MANKPAPAPKAPAPKAPAPEEAIEVAPASVEPTPEEALVHVTRKGSKQVMQVTREHYERYASKLEIVDA